MKSFLQLEYADYAYIVRYFDLRPLETKGYFVAETLSFIDWYPKVPERSVIRNWKKNFVIELAPSYKHKHFDWCWG